MKKLMLALAAALLTGCTSTVPPNPEKPTPGQPEPGQHEPGQPDPGQHRVGTADGALGERLSLSGQVQSWTPARAADLFLAGQKIGTIDAAGHWRVEGQVTPPQLWPVSEVFPQWLGAVEKVDSTKCKADLSVSDPAAQVATYEGWQLSNDASMRALLSPIPSRPALVRSRYESKTAWVTFLVYADRPVDLQGERTGVVTGWNGTPTPPRWEQKSELDLTLAKGWNVVTRQATYDVGASGHDVNTRTWDGEAQPELPWGYNGTPF